jgi:signal recognition particle subunit SRP19
MIEMMRRKSRSGWVIWTANLDKTLSRKNGRKIPKKIASPGVKLQELIEACSSLNLSFVAEEKRYPRCWWKGSGRVIVEKSKPKPKLMRDIAEKIKEIRELRERKAKRKSKKSRR